jgi:hypothetical protein
MGNKQDKSELFFNVPVFNNLRRGNFRGVGNDLMELKRKKDAAEKRLIVGAASRVGIKISDKNYDRLRMAMASTTPVGAALTLTKVLAKTPQGKSLINKIKKEGNTIIDSRRKKKEDDDQYRLRLQREMNQRIQEETRRKELEYNRRLRLLVERNREDEERRRREEEARRRYQEDRNRLLAEQESQRNAARRAKEDLKNAKNAEEARKASDAREKAKEEIKRTNELIIAQRKAEEDRKRLSDENQRIINDRRKKEQNLLTITPTTPNITFSSSISSPKVPTTSPSIVSPQQPNTSSTNVSTDKSNQSVMSKLSETENETSSTDIILTQVKQIEDETKKVTELDHIPKGQELLNRLKNLTNIVNDKIKSESVIEILNKRINDATTTLKNKIDEITKNNKPISDHVTEMIILIFKFISSIILYLAPTLIIAIVIIYFIYSESEYATLVRNSIRGLVPTPPAAE